MVIINGMYKVGYVITIDIFRNKYSPESIVLLLLLDSLGKTSWDFCC